MTDKREKHPNLKGNSPEITAARKKAFLAALVKTGIIGSACRAAQVPRPTVGNWRTMDEAFDDACKEAIEEAIDSLEEVADKRARGYEETLVYKDNIVWARNPDGTLKLNDDFEPIALTKVTQSDHVLLAMLKAKKPEYRDKSSVELSGPGGGPLPTKITVEFVESDGEGGMKDGNPNTKEFDPLED